MLGVERMIFTMDFSICCDGHADRSAGNGDIVPAAFMHFAIPDEQPEVAGARVRMKRGVQCPAGVSFQGVGRQRKHLLTAAGRAS